MSGARLLMVRKWRSDECVWTRPNTQVLAAVTIAEGVVTYVDRNHDERWSPDTHDEWRRLNEGGGE